MTANASPYQKDLSLPVQPGHLIPLFILSAASLSFEIHLTRLFSVAQFYHFAFMIVSLALLGFGASGSFLAAFSSWRQWEPHCATTRLALACSGSILGSYLFINWLPFDSFSIAWDRRQLAVLILHYLALAAPFFFSGMVVGLLLSAYPARSGAVYAVNLFGSAVGCLLPPLLTFWLGGEGVVFLSAGLAGIASLWPAPTRRAPGINQSPSAECPPSPPPCPTPSSPSRLLSILPHYLIALFLITTSFIAILLHLLGYPTPPIFKLRLSPYKSISYTLQYPEARLVYSRWNAFSRVDVVESPAIRSLPGLSYRYRAALPPEAGLFVDGDDLSPLLPVDANLDFSAYMPAALAYQLRPEATALILEPRGGLDVLIALAQGARRVTVVEPNPLILTQTAAIYADPRLETVIESGRTYLRRSRQTYDVIVISLTSTYRPISSGAYSLGEDYRYTVTAFGDALARLKPNGVLVISRWLQMPPSEELRLFATLLTAIEESGLNPAERILALRGYNQATLFASRSPFSADDLAALRAFCSALSFDPIYAPNLHPEETNRYNVLPTSIYYQTFHDLLHASDRSAWYRAYPFDVTPPRDDRPFFTHFFKWSQTRQVLAELGKTWQPFGGAGYLVLLALFCLTLLLAATLILLPLFVNRQLRRTDRGNLAVIVPTEIPPTPSAEKSPSLLPALIYFSLLGLAFLTIEIPLIQQFILYLGQPAYAFTVVLFTLLIFSGVGSRLSPRLPHRPALAVLTAILLALPWLLPLLLNLSLGLNLPARLIIAVAALAPVGFLMGIPFPKGLTTLEKTSPGFIPWAWAVNGTISVVASVLAALLALSFGFRLVWWLGAACYAVAWLTVPWLAVPQCGLPRR